MQLALNVAKQILGNNIYTTYKTTEFTLASANGSDETKLLSSSSAESLFSDWFQSVSSSGTCYFIQNFINIHSMHTLSFRIVLVL